MILCAHCKDTCGGRCRELVKPSRRFVLGSFAALLVAKALPQAKPVNTFKPARWWSLPSAVSTSYGTAIFPGDMLYITDAGVIAPCSAQTVGRCIGVASKAGAASMADVITAGGVYSVEA